MMDFLFHPCMYSDEVLIYCLVIVRCLNFDQSERNSGLPSME